MRAVPFAVAVAVALAAGGCAPLASFRPASGLMAERTFEIGAGGVLQTPRPYVDERAAAAGQVWASMRAARRVTVSGVTAFDAEGFAAGAALRFDLLRGDRVAVGLEPEAGFAWGALAVPFAIRVFDETWLYASPRVGTIGVDGALHLPAGLSARIYDGLMVRAEYAVLWTGELSYYQQRQLFGLGIAYQH